MRPIAYPQVWSTHDTIVCHEHDMWLNATAFRIDPKRPAIKLVGAAKADVALSHRRHQWLITHRGRDATRQAVRDAHEIVEDWNRWRLLEAIEYRCQELEPNLAESGLGTSCFNAGAYPRHLNARDLLVIATTGGSPLPAQNGRVPANAHVTDYLPYPLLLPHVDVMITNGGYGGVQQALRHGVPVIVAGETADKAEVAARVEYTGAGIDLGTARPTSVAISAAVNRILTTGHHRVAAQLIRNDLANSTALDVIADILANLPDQPITPNSAQDKSAAGE